MKKYWIPTLIIMGSVISLVFQKTGDIATTIGICFLSIVALATLAVVILGYGFLIPGLGLWAGWVNAYFGILYSMFTAGYTMLILLVISDELHANKFFAYAIYALLLLAWFYIQHLMLKRGMMKNLNRR